MSSENAFPQQSAIKLTYKAVHKLGETSKHPSYPHIPAEHEAKEHQKARQKAKAEVDSETV